jgi:hypothetical protein
MQPVDQDIRRVIDEAVKLLAAGVEERVAKGLGRILQSARNIERSNHIALPANRPGTRSRASVAARVTTQVGSSPTYAIVRRGGDEVLEERRPDRQPFRVNRELYGAVVRALAEADKPMDFEKLSDRVKRQLNRKELAAYLPRTVLRWWFSLNPSPLIRAHSEYQRRGTTDEFQKAADKSWKELAR